MREQQLQEKILKLINELPQSYAIKHNVISAYSRRGEPDIIACVCGKSVVIEVKTDAGKLSELQKKKLSFWEEAKSKAYVVTPSSYDDFEKDIKWLNYCRINYGSDEI